MTAARHDEWNRPSIWLKVKTEIGLLTTTDYFFDYEIFGVFAVNSTGSIQWQIDAARECFRSSVKHEMSERHSGFTFCRLRTNHSDSLFTLPLPLYLTLSLCQVSPNFAQHRMHFHTVHMHHMGTKTIWIDERNALRNENESAKCQKIIIGATNLFQFWFCLWPKKHIDAMWIRVFVFNKHECVLRAHAHSHVSLAVASSVSHEQ